MFICDLISLCTFANLYLLFNDVFSFFVVAGESLRKIFSSGLREEMDRSLLARQSTVTKPVSGSSSAKVASGIPKPVEAVSGVVVEVDPAGSGVVGDNGLRERKRGRDREGGASQRIVLRRCDETGRESSREDVGKLATAAEVVELPPILQPTEPIS